MPDPVGIRVHGLNDFRKELRKAGADLPRALREANRSAPKAAIPAIRSRAPEKSGALKGSVRALASQSRGQIAVGTNVKVPYAGPINFGWPARGIAPQEFIYSGIVASNEKIVEVYGREIDKLLDRIGRGIVGGSFRVTNIGGV